MKHTTSWVYFPGWAEVPKTGHLESGDVVVFIEDGKIVEGSFVVPTIHDPSVIKSETPGNKGFVISGWHGKPVLYIYEYYRTAKPGMYTVFRKDGKPIKRPYVPSKWATPVPLP